MKDTKELKKNLEQGLKFVDQLDLPSLLGISGLMLLLTLVFGGFADLIALLVGVAIGLAVAKKILL